MWKEFKEFAMQGNVVDLAVAVVIGGAFGKIVTAFVDNIITPIIGVLCGGVDFSGLAIHVGEAAIGYGALIQAIIDFLLIAFVLFMIIKALNKAKAAVAEEKEEAPAEPEETPADIALLTEIRDLLKK